MTETRTAEAATTVTYDLRGTLLEACSCGVLCPCWVGEDPDGGTCEAFNAYHLDRGEIRGIDVSGLSVVNVVQIPGNVLTQAAGGSSPSSTNGQRPSSSPRSSTPTTAGSVVRWATLPCCWARS